MLLLIPHLFPPARLLQTAAQNLRLPALETLLARGTRLTCPAEGVEAALCEALGIMRQQDWPLAPITLEADGGTAGNAYWLRADPVHLRVMRDRIVLADRGALDLSRPEAEALAAAIGQHFGDALRPLPLHPQRWYLCPSGHLPLAQPPRLTTTPFSLAAGCDIDPLLPQGEDARTFRSLLNEVQMLLHDHPVNQAREARGALPVNALWLWGGGVRPAVPATRMTLCAQDDAVLALAKFSRARVLPLPPRLQASLLESADVVVIDALTTAGETGDPYGWREAIRGLEQSGFAPLLGALRMASLRRVRILDPVNGAALELRRGDVWKLWRRPRSPGLMDG